MSLSKIALAAGIAVVFATFVAYGVSVVYEAPKYYDYPQNDCYQKYNCYSMVDECEKNYRNISNISVYEPMPFPAECTAITQSAEYMACLKSQEKCNEDYAIASPQYNYTRTLFYILLAIGIGAVIAGNSISAEGVGAGFIGGGVLLIIFSIIRSFEYLYSLDKYLKLAGLGLALAVLIYMGNKKLKNSEKL